VGGMRRNALQEIADSFVNDLLARHIRPGALNALRYHLAAGHRVLLASASLDFYVVTLAMKLGVNETVCTGSVWIGDRLASALRPRNCYGEEKLRRVAALLGNSPNRPYVYAYTDHHSDIGLLDWANHGVAVNPDPRLRAHCELRGLPIVDWDQNA